MSLYVAGEKKEKLCYTLPTEKWEVATKLVRELLNGIACNHSQCIGSFCVFLRWPLVLGEVNRLRIRVWRFIWMIVVAGEKLGHVGRGQIFGSDHL